MKKASHITRTAVLLLLAGISVSNAQVSLSLPATGGQSGASMNIPLTVGSVTGLGVTAFQFVLTYDTAIVNVTGVDGSGTLSTNFTTVTNTTFPGQLRVASAGITPIVGSGTLLVLKAQLKNAGTSALNFTDFRFNEGSPLAATVNGKVVVQKLNRAPVIISGTPVVSVVALNLPITFKVRASDPDGDTLTFAWKRDGNIVQSGKDSLYTTTFGGKYGDPHTVVCVVSDPGGLQTTTSWAFTVTAVEREDGATPNQYVLSQNYPNPFNPRTTIQFDVPATSSVTLEIYDLMGIRVRTLLGDRRMNPGRHSEVWNGLDDNGSPVPSGTYMYRLRTADRSFSRKMTLLK
ncbi:MAG: cohesin domain-containing protein [Ignavibacteriales bacterium]|nr:cohesin domain-containing protein [Ignavibacteriales bacterium]